MKKRWLLLMLILVSVCSCYVGYYFNHENEDIVYTTLQHGSSIDLTQLPIDTKDKEEPKEEEEKPIVQITEPTKENKIVQLQLQQSVQETHYYCVPACVQMVLRYHGIEVSQSDLAKEMKAHPVTGTEYIDMVKTLNAYLFHTGVVEDTQPGYHIQTIAVHDQDPSIAQTFEQRIKMDIDHQDPAFAAIDVHALYPLSATGNHMIVITGYEWDSTQNRIKKYYILDPSYVVQDATYGGKKIVSSEELMRAIITNDEPAYLW